MRVLFRLDANLTTGFGHFSRCCALANEINSRGGETTFLINTDSYQSIKERLSNSDLIEVQLVDCLASDIVNTELKRNIHDVLVLDSYSFDLEYQNSLTLDKTFLTVFDDGINLQQRADLIINQTPNAEKYFLYQRTGNYQYSCSGSNYICLSANFLSYLDNERIISDNCSRLLICLGGGDYENYTAKILDYLSEIELKNIEIHIILGPSNPNEFEINEICKKLNLTTKIIKNCMDMPAEILAADLVIASSGVIVWELAFLQTPMILGSVADNQKHNLDNLLRLELTRPF